MLSPLFEEVRMAAIYWHLENAVANAGLIIHSTLGVDLGLLPFVRAENP